MSRVVALGVAFALLAPAPALADEPTPRRRALAVGAAIVPGLVVRGSGSWVAGERATARRLLWAELIGLGLAAAGGLPVGLSRGAEETMPGLALIVPGGGLLVTSWLADLYAAAGLTRLGGTAAPVASAEVGVGYLRVIDADLPVEHLATLDAWFRLGRGQGRIAGWAGEGAWRGELAGGVGLVTADEGGTRVEVEASVAREDREVSGYALTSGEVAARGRVDLRRLAPPLAGSFASLGLAGGVERSRFDASGDVDVTSLFGGRFGWGLYLGDGAGEVEVYYEHRRDTLAGGLTPPSAANGFLGYLGLAGAAWRGRWGLAGSLEIGSAYLLALAVRARLEAP